MGWSIVPNVIACSALMHIFGKIDGAVTFTAIWLILLSNSMKTAEDAAREKKENG